MLKVIIQLQQIRDKIEEGNLSNDCRQKLLKEFISLKNTLLKSNFAFDNVKKLVLDIEHKFNAL